MEGVLEVLQLKPLDVGMILICVGLFSVYWQVAEAWFFKPLLRLYELRERLTSGATDSASDIRREAEKLSGIYRDAIDSARGEAVTKRLERISLATTEANRIVGEAEDEARVEIEKGRAEIQENAARMSKELSRETEQLARNLVEKILTGTAMSSGVQSSLCILLSAISLFSAGSILISPAEVFAAGGAGHIPSFRDTFIYWPNFLCFLVLVVFFLRKPFQNHLANRAESIAASVTAGEIAKAEALTELAKARELHAGVDEEVRGLIQRIESEATHEVEKIVTDAKVRAEKIKERASQSITSERASMEKDLQEELAQKVIQRAEEILGSELSDEKDKAIRESALSRIGAVLY